MTEPPPKISNRRANMVWPVRVSILSLQPWKHVLQFVDVRREGEAVSEIYTAITKGEKLCAEQNLSATETNGRTDKNGLEALLPSQQKVTCKRSRPIVQPIVLKRAALGPDLNGKTARGLGNPIRDLRKQNVAILRQARHNAWQIKRGATIHYRIELKASLGQVLIKGEYDCMCFVLVSL
jgi:hypothetical protein